MPIFLRFLYELLMYLNSAVLELPLGNSQILAASTDFSDIAHQNIPIPLMLPIKKSAYECYTEIQNSDD